METSQQHKLEFLGVGFPMVVFKSTGLYIPNEHSIELEIIPKVFFLPNDNQQFKIVMEVNLNVENIFNLSLLAIGEFKHSESIEEKMKQNFVNTNAPAIVFPYVRSYISTLTSISGSQISPINLPPQIFKGQLEELEVDKLSKI